MTLRDMRLFAEVAKSLSMSRSAEALGLAQPTVSQVIATIEDEYGVRLFERLKRKLYLTSDGSYLLSYVQSILALYDEVDANLGSFALPVTLRIGATITVGSTVLGPLVSCFEQEHPEVTVEVYVDNTQTIVTMLKTSRLDIGFVEGQVYQSSLVAEDIISDSLVLVAASDFPIADELSLKDLGSIPFILREEGSGTREIFLQALEEEGVTIWEKWVCHSSDAIISAVASGQGVSVISKRLVAKELEEGVLREVAFRNAELRRMFSLVYHKDKFFTPPLELFAKHIRLLQEKST